MNLCDLNPFLRFAAEMLYDTTYNGTDVQVSDCRLFSVLEGTARLSTEGRHYQLAPGCLFYCCAGSRYSIHTRDGLRLMILNFDLTQQHNSRLLPISPSRDPAQWDSMPIHADDVSDSAFLNGHLFLESVSNLQSRIEQIIDEFSSGDRYSRELSSAALKILLTQLHRTDQAQIPPKIALIQDYIRENFAQDITNQDLAALAGYHEYHLNRLFTACTGTSLHEYLLKVRLNRASFLILNTDMNLQDIPEQVGFRSYPHFSSYFKQTYGYSPAEYRKRLKSSI